MAVRGVASAVLASVIATVAAGCGFSEETGGARSLNWYVFNEPGGANEAAIKSCNERAHGGRSQGVSNV